MVRLRKAMQEKLKTASYSEKIQIFTLVPDKWPRMCCSESFNVFEIKKVGGILAKPATKKENNYHHRNTSSCNKRL